MDTYVREKDPIMNLTPEQFEEFMALEERNKWKAVWNALRLLEFYIDNTDDTLVNVSRAFHELTETVEA